MLETIFCVDTFSKMSYVIQIYNTDNLNENLPSLLDCLRINIIVTLLLF